MVDVLDRMVVVVEDVNILVTMVVQYNVWPVRRGYVIRSKMIHNI